MREPKCVILVIILLSFAAWKSAESAQIDVGSVPVSTSVQHGVFLMRVDPPTPRGFPAWFTDYNLLYSSAYAGRELAGEGWSLEGLSAITRCPKTFGIDGAVREIQGNSDDFLCFDGQRLHSVLGSYWSIGSSYRTEIDTFNKVSATEDSQGVLFFTVRTKDNRILTYGSRSDSRFSVANVTWEWRLDTMADSLGCKVNLSYLHTGLSVYLDRVSYSDVEIRYDYETRPDVTTNYYRGQISRVHNLRLSSIAAMKMQRVEKTLHLQYSNDPSLRLSVLASVTMCANRSCLNPTVFQYSGLADDSVSSPAVWTSEFSNRIWSQDSYRFADLNNDGLTDFVAFGHNTVRVGLNNLGQNFDPSKEFFPLDKCFNCFEWSSSYLRKVVDVNGDGLPDIFGVSGTGSGNNLKSMTNMGNLLFSGLATRYASLGGVGTFQPILGDFDGDGLVDILHTEVERYLYVSLNIPENPGAWKNAVGWVYHSFLHAHTRSLQEPIFVGDVNGDTLPDIVMFTTLDNGVNLFLNNGNNFSSPVSTGLFDYSRGWRVEWDKRVLADVNGDGLHDLLGVYRNGTTFVALSEGNNFKKPALWLEDAGVRNPQPWDTQLIVDDVNADSLADLVLVTRAEVRVALNSGRQSFELPVIWLQNHTLSVNYTNLVDVTGDNVPDFVSLSPSGVSVAVNKNSRVRLTSAVDGLGLQVKVEYSTTADREVYRDDGQYSSVFYPMSAVNLRQSVVSQVLTDDGVGGTNATSYTYDNIRYDVTGRSKPVYTRITEWHHDRRLSATHEFYQHFPLTAALKTVTHKVDNTTTMHSRYTYQVVKAYQHQNKSVFAVNLVETAEEHRDLRGDLLKTKTASAKHDAFGNVEMNDVSVRSGSLTYRQTTKFTYSYPDIEFWLVNQLIYVNETYEVSGMPKLTKSASLSYYGNRKLHKKVEEPDSPIGLETIYSYDQCGRVTEELKRPVNSSGRSLDRSTTYHYTTAGTGYPDTMDRITDTFGQTVVSYKYDGFGNVIESVDVNELTTRRKYDVWRRKVGETHPDGVEVTIEYLHDNSLPLSAYRVVRSETMKPKETRVMDKLDRPIRIVTEGFLGDDVYIDFKYDKFGRLAAKSRPYYPAHQKPVFVRTKYDLLGRVVTTLDEATNTTKVTQYKGFSATTVNNDGSKRVTTSDPFGKTVSVVDELGGKLDFTYDSAGNLVQTNDPAGNVVQMWYDERGNKVGLRDPNMGNWTYTYNSFGELVRTVDAKNQVTVLDYDQLGRPVLRSDDQSITTFAYNSDANLPGQRSGLRSVKTSDGYQRTFEYNSLGQLATESRLIDGNWYRRSTSYRAGKLVKAEHYDGSPLFYCYNSRGFLVSIRTDGNCSGNVRGDRAEIWRALTYFADGKVKKERHGNRATTAYKQDAKGRTVSIVSKYGNVLLRDWQYEYDEDLNLKSRRDGAAQFHTVEEFRYDALRRLVHARIRTEDDDFYEENSESWTYDSTGNILSYRGYDGEFLDYRYSSSAPHAVTSAGSNVFRYDGNGNMVNRNKESIGWTVDNRMKSIETKLGRSVRFDYDPQSGFRYRKVLYSSRKAAASSSNSSLNVVSKHSYFDKYFETSEENGRTTLKINVYADGRLIAVQTFAQNVSKVRYMHTDHIGSVDTITDSNGNIVESVRYTPFGRVRSRKSGAGSEPQGTRYFVSHEALDEDGLGLIHMIGRVYDPLIGRFLSPDISVQFMQDPASHNRYSYCMNNPLAYNDPSGYFFGSLFRTIFSIFSPRNLIPLLVGGLVSVIAGPIAGGMVSGALSGAINTGTPEGAFKGAVLGGVSAGLGSAVGAIGSAVSIPTTNTLGKALSSVVSAATNTPVGKIATSAVAGGMVEMASGGTFEDGFARGLVTSGASQLYSHMVRYDIDPSPGAEAVKKGFNQMPNKGHNNIGTQGKAINPNSLFGEGGKVSRLLNLIPGINAVAGIHDTMMVHLAEPMRTILNVPLMVPAYAITMVGLMDQIYLYQKDE